MNPTRQPAALDPDLAETPPLPGEKDPARDKLRTVGPWVLSLAGHAGVVLLAACLVVAVKNMPVAVAPPPVELDPEGEPGPVHGVKLNDDTTSTLGDLPSGPPTETPLPPEISQPPMPKAPSSPGGAHDTARLPDYASVVVPRVAGHSGGGGKSIFDMGNNGTGKRGLGGGAHPVSKIVFLVDASGSLVDTLPFVIDDLSGLLDSRLGNEKKFNVIFFSGKTVNRDIGASRGIAELFPSGLEPATIANRRKAVDWIQRVEAGGSGDALAAIRKALEMDPDQIHLLSDNITGSGVWEMHQDRFMAEMKVAYDKAVARRQGVRVDFKTYQFVYPDPLAQIGRQPTLRRLVEETGGLAADYKFVTARDLGLR